MTDDTKNRIIEDIEEMTRLAEQYGAATNEIITTDIDETLEDILRRRGELTDKIGICRKDLDEQCAEYCTAQETALIVKMLTGGHVPLGMTKEMRDIHKTAVRMHSVYLSIADKEKQAAARVDARIKELRADLENVNAVHKTVRSYSGFNTGIGSGTGNSFNGQM